MRINTNVMAFNATRNLGISNTSLGSSLEKLSSGYRINRAGDDAAGLV
ncbi:MAG: flagellin, partial [Acidimicrobiales bacterium]